MEYTWDKELNLFHRANIQPFAYSDGAEVEQRLFALIQSAGDKGTFSLELSEGINDWPSEYHLSRARHCLIRPLGIEPGERVLELGCGCGAITRYLGEIGAKVVAVEGSFERARIAAERCRDLPNVKVFVDDLLNFETVEQFDWIILVGVLEYAPVFTDEKEPVQHYLRSVTRFLAPHGKLVIAIENKLGLKYFNNCSEDHLGVPFVGIQNLYGNKTPRTFGRQELIGQLTAAGFLNTYFYYPFPDYKLPSVVISDDALFEPQFNAVDLIIRAHARDYTGSPYRLFDDALVYSALSENGLFSEMSNSFLVVAARTQAPLSSHKLAMSFSINRLPEFSVLTTFCRTDESISVTKEAIAPFLARTHYFHDGFDISNVLSRSNYHLGSQLLWRVLSVRANNGTLDQVVAALQPWFNYIIQYATSDLSEPTDDKVGMNNLKHFLVPGNFIDCTPFNIIETTQGLIYIDDEWQANCVVPLGWVVARSVLHSLRVGLATGDLTINTTNVVQALCKSSGLSVTEADIASWVEMEARFVSFVTGQAPSNISKSLSRPTSDLISLNQSIFERDEQITSLNQSIVERDGQITSLNQNIVERDEQIASLNQSIVERDEQIASLNQSIVERDEQIASLNQSIVERDERITSLNQSIVERDGQITSLNQNIVERDEQITSPNQSIVERDGQIACLNQGLAERDGQIAAILNSSSWRITRPMRLLGDQFKRATYLLRILPQKVAQKGGIRRTFVAVLRVYRREGLAGIKYRIKQSRAIFLLNSTMITTDPSAKSSGENTSVALPYNDWVKWYGTLSHYDQQAIRLRIQQMLYKPLISVIMPVYNTQEKWLRLAIESVERQLYPYWELCIADDCSDSPHIHKVLEEYQRRDKRVKVVFRSENGHISRASNSALDLVQGEFIAMLDHDDELSEHALYLVAEELNRNKELDFLYSDQDKIDVNGVRYDPYFKPDFNPDLLRSQNYVDHLAVFRTSIVRKLGGWRTEFDGSQDYDMVLRTVEHTTPSRIQHIPYVLYHWRSVPGSIASDAGDKGYAASRSRKALFGHLQRLRINAKVTSHYPDLSIHRVIYPLPEEPPLVSVIVPTKDGLDFLSRCINGLLNKTDYSKFEVIVINNRSEKPETYCFQPSNLSAKPAIYVTVGGGKKSDILRH